MKGRVEIGGGLTLFTGAALILLILWVPVLYQPHTGIDEYFMLLCIWSGIMYTVTMQSFRTAGYPVTLFPVFQGYMAVTGYTVLQETGFLLAVFLGTIIYLVRVGEPAGSILHRGMTFTLICLLSLRITAFIVQGLRSDILSFDYLAAAALPGAVIVSVFINRTLRFLMESRRTADLKASLTSFLRSVVYPGFFVLFLLPAALQTESASRAVPEWNLLAGVLTVAVVQTGLSLLLGRARFSHSRTRFLQNELGRHSEILTGLDTSIEALKTLTHFWCRAADSTAVRVTWRNVSVSSPAGFEAERDAPLRREGPEGLVLEIWPSSRTTLDSDRVEIFTLQTETVLKNLELRESVFMRGRNCLEAMLYSLDKSDSRQTGYSRKVADLAGRIGRELDLPEDELEDLEISALLHLASSILERAREDWEEIFPSNLSGEQFQLPSGVVSGIVHMRENYDGSGRPDGLSGSSIPIISRILSVSSSLVTGAESQSAEGALVDIRRRTGMIYDPVIVEALENVMAEPGGTDAAVRSG